MARRSRKSSFLPLIARVLAIAAIGFVAYRIMSGAPPLTSGVTTAHVEEDADGNSESTPLIDKIARVDVAENATKIKQAGASKSSSFWNYLGYTDDVESDSVDPSEVTEAVEAASLAANFSKSSAKNSSFQSPIYQTASQTRAVAEPPSRNGPGSENRRFNEPSKSTSAASVAFRNEAPKNNSVIGSAPFAQRTQPAADGVTAEQIFSTMQSAYRRLSGYEDNGKITFSYRRGGQLTQEESPFSTAWNARAGQYAGKVFKSELVCDGEKLSCFIFDIDTENFGNQQLVIPTQRGEGPPIARLLSDPYAKDFLAGAEDFTLNPPSKGFKEFVLPPALALLSGQVSSPWIANGAGVKRLADEKVGSFDCYQLQSQPPASNIAANGGTRRSSDGATLWIDKETKLIRKIKYPSTLFISEIVDAPEITELELFATFTDQKIDSMMDTEQFKVKPYRSAKPVTRFVSLPAKLPADSIGQIASAVELIDRNGTPVTVKNFKDQITTIAWIGNEQNVHLIDKLAAFKKSYSKNFSFNVAFLPDMATDDGSGRPRPIDEIRRKERLGVPFLFDSGRTLSALQVQALPTLLVLDRAGKVVFAQNMTEMAWTENLKAALSQVDANRDLATEMVADYKKHYTDYARDIEKYDASELLGISRDNPAVVDNDAFAKRERNRDTTVELTPNRKWQTSEFAKPGNVLVLPEGDFGRAKLAIFDGFQTLKFLDDAGRVLAQTKLAIPEDQAVSVLRYNAAGDGAFAAFGKMGKQVHFFDKSFELLRSFPAIEQAHAGITDCQPDPSKAGQFLVSFNDRNGVYRFDALSGSPEKESEAIVSSMLSTDDSAGPTIAVSDFQLMQTAGWKPITRDSKLQYHRLVAARGGEAICCATVRSGANTWSAVGLSNQLKELWSVALKSQLLQTEVEPLAAARTDNGQTFWAVVDNNDTVCLISDSGAWLGDFKANSEVHGIAVVENGNQVDLIVSTEKDVTCWALNYRAIQR